jgi:hypothetical protein
MERRGGEETIRKRSEGIWKCALVGEICLVASTS